MGIEVRSVQGPAEVAVISSSGPGEESSSQSSFFSSSLLSLGSKVGIGFFQCLSYLFIEGYIHVSRLIGGKSKLEYQPPTFEKKKYDLSDWEDFQECFERDPLQGANQLLDLLEEEPLKFRSIVLTAVERSGQWNRAAIISKIEEVFLHLLMSPEVLFHENRIANMEFSNEEAIWMQKKEDDGWDPKGKPIRVISTRNLQEKYNATKEQASQIWKKCYAFIQAMIGEELKVLKLFNQDQYVGEGRVEIKLGDFLERLQHMVGFQVLVARKQRFDPLMRNLRNVLSFLNRTETYNLGQIRDDNQQLTVVEVSHQEKIDLSSLPEFSKLIKRVDDILQKPNNQEVLFALTEEMIARSSDPIRRTCS